MPTETRSPPLTNPKPLSRYAIDTLLRCAVGYAMQSTSYLSLTLPEVLTDDALANASTETLTLVYQDIRSAMDKANRTHQYIGDASTHLVWESISNRIGDLVTARNKPSWKARPR